MRTRQTRQPSHTQQATRGNLYASAPDGGVHRRRITRAQRRRQQRRRRNICMSVAFCALLVMFACSTFWLKGTHAQPVGLQGTPAPASKAETTYTIVLDSGHSTYNVGAHGLVKEEEITAKTTEYLRALLAQNEQFDVILTHEYDVHATLAERRDVGISSQCDFFLSIHCNSYEGDNDVHGFEVYAQLPENQNHTESYAMARSITEKFIAAGHTPRAGSGIFYCRYVPDENGEDVQYTLTEQEEADTDFGGTTYGVIKSDAYPAVLIEQGYVNSQKDVDAWMSDRGAQAAAAVYYEALCDYFGV